LKERGQEFAQIVHPSNIRRRGAQYPVTDQRFQIASPEIVPSGQFTRMTATKVLLPLIP